MTESFNDLINKFQNIIDVNNQAKCFELQTNANTALLSLTRTREVLKALSEKQKLLILPVSNKISEYSLLQTDGLPSKKPEFKSLSEILKNYSHVTQPIKKKVRMSAKIKAMIDQRSMAQSLTAIRKLTLKVKAIHKKDLAKRNTDELNHKNSGLSPADNKYESSREINQMYVLPPNHNVASWISKVISFFSCSDQ